MKTGRKRHTCPHSCLSRLILHLPPVACCLQNTDVFQVQSYTACGINLVQYLGFGLNATNLLLQPDNW